tara:strand:+ start:425 stop:607 length:183 start_codon:yes stop_codon:yes gene_type:complete
MNKNEVKYWKPYFTDEEYFSDEFLAEAARLAEVRRKAKPLNPYELGVVNKANRLAKKFGL